MHVVVIKRFRDKYTGNIHSIGDEIEVTKERAAEIMVAGEYIVIPSGQPEESDPSEAPEQSEILTKPDEESQKPEVAPAQHRRGRKPKD